jgi:hypothetical protein
MVRQNPTYIQVHGEHGDYGETPDNLWMDFGRKIPDLPEGVEERVYEPGVRHVFRRGAEVVEQALVWEEGDQMIAKGAEMLANRQARDQAQWDTLEAQRAQKMAEWKAEDEARQKQWQTGPQVRAPEAAAAVAALKPQQGRKQ